MMFRSAYLRLTGFYVLILMVISLAFSAWVYNEATRELRSGIFKVRAQFGGPFVADIDDYIQQQIYEGRMRVLANLIYLNIAVLGLGAGASYLLARRTMQPIEEAMAAQDRFTADASHELRTPLAAMKAEIEVALRDKKLTKQESDELLLSNLEEIDRLSNLAEDLLVLAHNAEDISLVPIRLDIAVQKVSERFLPLATKKDISFSKDLKKVEIQAEKQALDKLIGILIDNAIKYSPQGSSVKIRTFREGNNAVFTVTDLGYGIKASELPYIFDRFYRADASRTKNAGSGHGLGLAIAKKIATTLKATIEVESKAGKGSTFSIKFPL